jgi:RNA polymerase sigma factor (sigma-70 family)
MKMTSTDQDLLRQFVRERSQDAFTSLVNRHLNLVHSAALRQVRSPQLAEEVCQSVFTRLACKAAELAPDIVLTAWLYSVTRHAAIDVVRQESRRQTREQLAVDLNHMSPSTQDWTEVEPLLDEAMDSLGQDDRTAILLRYFENKSLHEVGQALGASEDAAQKRVSRALDRLREHLSKRRVEIGAAGLAALLSTNAVQAAPVGLAGALATSAFTASAVLTTGATAAAITHTIAMTTIQKSILIVVTAGALAIGLHQALQSSKLRKEVQALRQQEQAQAALLDAVKALQRQRDQASNELADVSRELATLKKNPADVNKLRGEVGRLRRENAVMGSSSPLSKVTANPEAVKMLREQQKVGMGVLYKGFAQSAKLTPEQTQKLNDLLADHVMENVNHVTTALRDKPTVDEMNGVFAAENRTLQDQLRELLGDDGLAKYEDYTQRLLSTLSAEQFKTMLTGPDTAKEEKAKQLSEAIQQSVQESLASSGLPADYQVLPILNFVNIASEQQGEQAVKLMDDIYQRATTRAGSFLSADELGKFQQFRTTAINNNRAALALNRSMMAPISQ